MFVPHRFSSYVAHHLSLDLQRLLSIDKSNAAARHEIESLRETYGISETRTSTRNEPNDAMDIEDESDSEDFTHLGKGLACRYYNTRVTGCRKGTSCLFRHAPDSKSIRDELCVVLEGSSFMY